MPFTGWGIPAISAAAFTPTDISGLKAWYDFSDATTLFEDTARTDPVDIDTDLIKGVTDKSGSNNHITEGTNPPTYKTNILNSKSVARFDGTNDVLQNTSATPLGSDTNGANYTLFCVGKCTGVTNDDTFFSLRYTGGGNAIKAQMTFRATAIQIDYRCSDGSGLTLTGTQDSDDGTNRIYMAREESRVQKMYVSGGSPDTSAALTNSAITVDTINVGCIGFSGAVDGFLAGDIAEIILYNSALSVTDMNRVGNYLESKWNLTWTDVS